MNNLDWLKAALPGATPDRCLMWPFTPRADGYGRVALNGTRMGAHQAALVLSGHPRPGVGMDASALHSCDQPLCVNPHHLRWGNHRANMMDRFDPEGDQARCPCCLRAFRYMPDAYGHLNRCTGTSTCVGGPNHWCD